MIGLHAQTHLQDKSENLISAVHYAYLWQK